MTPREAVMAMLAAELASGHATVRSLGVLYAMAIACKPLEDMEWWRAVNGTIRANKNFASIKRIDAIKKVGWELNGAIAAAVSSAA